MKYNRPLITKVVWKPNSWTFFADFRNEQKMTITIRFLKPLEGPQLEEELDLDLVSQVGRANLDFFFQAKKGPSDGPTSTCCKKLSFQLIFSIDTAN